MWWNRMEFHTGTDATQYSILDAITKMYMTLSVPEQQSIPAWHIIGAQKYVLSKLIWVEL